MFGLRFNCACLLVTGSLASGCGGAHVPATSRPVSDSPTTADASWLPDEVVDTTWRWVSLTTPVEQITVDTPDRYTIRFSRDGRVAVQADCNRGVTTYSASGGRAITLRPMALTRAACQPGSLGERFARDVSRAATYFLRDGELYLELPMDSGTLRFRR